MALTLPFSTNIFPSTFLSGGRMTDSHNYIKTDILVDEGNSSYHIICDVPGANNSNLHLEVENEHNTGVLHLSYNRNVFDNIEDRSETSSTVTTGGTSTSSSTAEGSNGSGSKNVLYNETPSGLMVRTIRLQGLIDTDNIKAKLDNGCLCIEVPKKENKYYARKRLPIH